MNNNILQQKQQDVITNQLILHLNRKLSNIETNANNEIIYNLKDPIQIRKNDSVELYQAMLNVRGQNSQTMNIDEDMSVTIRFCHWIPDSPANVSSVGEDACFTMRRAHEYQACPDENFEVMGANSHKDYEDNYNIFAMHNIFHDLYNRPQGAPMIMGNCFYQKEVSNASLRTLQDNKNGAATARFQSVTKTINIKAGNYDVNSLSDIIKAQLNLESLDSEENILLQDKGDKVNSFVDNKLLRKISNYTDGIFGKLQFNNRGVNQGFLNMGIPDVRDNVATTVEIEEIENQKMVFWDLKTFNRIKENCEIFYNNPDDPRIKGANGHTMFNLIEPREAFFAGNMGEIYGHRRGNLMGIDKLFEYDRCRYPVPVNLTTQINGFVPKLNMDIVKYQDPSHGGDDVYAGITFTDQNSQVTKGYAIGQNEYKFKNANIPDIVDSSRIIGSKSIDFSFAGGKINRFAFSNFHEPYRIPTYALNPENQNSTLVTNSNAGQEATLLYFQGGIYPGREIFTASITSTNLENVPGSAKYWNNTDTDLNKYMYHIEASSGISILSFDEEAKKKTAKWIDLQTKINYILANNQEMPTFTYWYALEAYRFLQEFMPHDWFFESDFELKKSWSGSFWDKFGFTYKDLGNITDISDEYYSSLSLFDIVNNLYKPATDPKIDINKFKMPGFITHNMAGSGINTGISWLGSPIYPDGSSTQVQGFDTVDLFSTNTITPLVAYDAEDGFEGASPTLKARFDSREKASDPVVAARALTIDPTKLSYFYNIVPFISEPQFYNASNYPNLSGNQSYFLIESDLIYSNSLDAQSNKKTVIGLVNKENSSADMLFGGGISSFVFNQDKLLNSISIKITNPDGTAVGDGVLQDSSGFIFILNRQVNQLEY